MNKIAENIQKLKKSVKSTNGLYERAFVAIAGTFGLILVFLVPPLWGFDEISHFARVYQIAEGNVRPDLTGDVATHGGFIPKNLRDVGDYVIQDSINNTTRGVLDRKDVDSTEKYSEITSARPGEEKAVFTWSASYSPVAYVGQVAGVMIAKVFNGSIGNMIILSRIGGLLVYIGLIYAAIRIQPKGSKLKPLIFLVGLIPTALLQAATVTADSISIGLSILFISIFIVLLGKTKDDKYTKELLASLFVIALILPLTKVNYFLLSVAVLFLPAAIFMSKKAAIRAKVLVVAGAALLAIAWSKSINGVGAAPATQRQDGLPIDPMAQLMYTLTHPLDMVVVMIRTLMKYADSLFMSMHGAMGNNNFTVPAILIITMAFTILVATLYARDMFTKIRKYVWLMIVLSALSIGSVFLAMYLAFNPVGHSVIDGVQGRYFLPLLIPILAWLSLWIPFDIRISKRASQALFISVPLLVMIPTVVLYAMTLF